MGRWQASRFEVSVVPDRNPDSPVDASIRTERQVVSVSLRMDGLGALFAFVALHVSWDQAFPDDLAAEICFDDVRPRSKVGSDDLVAS